MQRDHKEDHLPDSIIKYRNTPITENKRHRIKRNGSVWERPLLCAGEKFYVYKYKMIINL